MRIDMLVHHERGSTTGWNSWKQKEVQTKSISPCLNRQREHGVRQTLERNSETVRKKDAFSPVIYEGIIKMGVEFSSDLMADVVSMIPGTKRESRQLISFESKDYIEAWKCMYAAILLAGITY